MNDIIVVGNGPSVLDKALGKVIDSFDTVVRINNFVIISEETTGVKTNVWATSKTYEPKLAGFVTAELKYLLGNVDCGDYRHKALLTAGESCGKRVEIVPLSFKKKINAEYQKEYTKHFKDTKLALPSTGLVILNYFVNYKKQKISCVGIDNFIRSRPHHYASKKRFALNSPHKPEIEKKFFDSWVKEGKVFCVE